MKPLASTLGRQVSAGNVSTMVLGAAIIVLAAVAAVANPRFLSLENLQNILVQTSYLSIFTLAQSIPLLTRGFDLSLGSVVSAASLCTAFAFGIALPFGFPAALGAAVLAGLACGAVVGALNGVLIGFAGLNPFIVTLGVWNIVLGVVAVISGGFPQPVDPAFNQALYQATLFIVPVPVAVTALIYVSAWWLLDKTLLGRQLYLVGANPKASSLAGVNTQSVTFKAYFICGLVLALGAVLLTARTGSGEPNLGGALTLQSIAAAVVGGVSLRGGEGRFYSPLMGALFITVLTSALNFLRVESYPQMIVMGIVIIASVCVDQYRRY